MLFPRGGHALGIPGDRLWLSSAGMFHSLRHTSVTYKLKLNGGDIKAVQGDSGHSQINMVTDVYSHSIDDDRRKNAELLAKVLSNPEMAALLSTLAKSLESK